MTTHAARNRVQSGNTTQRLIFGASILLFAAGLPLTLGQRLLLGSGRNHIGVACGVVQPVAAVLLAVGLRVTGAQPDAYVLAPRR